MKILLVGATGSMGKTIVEICKSDDEYEIVAGTGSRKCDYDFPLYEDFSSIVEDFDIIIDFSNHNAIDGLLNFAIEVEKPLVIATTGHNEEQIEAIRAAAVEIPILHSGNMSIGINVLLSIVENLSKSLKGFDIEIIEKHHKLKVDSPSGTAKMLFNSANAGRDNSLHEVDGRSGNTLSRDESEVGMHSVRGGTIVGEHSVLFTGLDEVIDITHIAQSKKIFANGALQACDFLINCDAGLYNMRDIFEF